MDISNNPEQALQQAWEQLLFRVTETGASPQPVVEYGRDTLAHGQASTDNKTEASTQKTANNMSEAQQEHASIAQQQAAEQHVQSAIAVRLAHYKPPQQLPPEQVAAIATESAARMPKARRIMQLCQTELGWQASSVATGAQGKMGCAAVNAAMTTGEGLMNLFADPRPAARARQGQTLRLLAAGVLGAAAEAAPQALAHTQQAFPGAGNVRVVTPREVQRVTDQTDSALGEDPFAASRLEQELKRANAAEQEQQEEEEEEEQAQAPKQQPQPEQQSQQQPAPKASASTKTPKKKKSHNMRDAVIWLCGGTAVGSSVAAVGTATAACLGAVCG